MSDSDKVEVTKYYDLGGDKIRFDSDFLTDDWTIGGEVFSWALREILKDALGSYYWDKGIVNRTTNEIPNVQDFIDFIKPR